MAYAKTYPTRPLASDAAGDHVPAPLPLDPRLVALMEKHGDLDGAIAALLASGSRDDLRGTRRKKRERQIKGKNVQVIAAH